jgi:hypothetical protein
MDLGATNQDRVSHSAIFCLRAPSARTAAFKIKLAQASTSGTLAAAEGVAPDVPRLTKPFRSIDFSAMLAPN